MLVFNGGEIVRLKQDNLPANLRAGDCGIVWGVYNTDPPQFEACFCNQDKERVDVMFEIDEVEMVDDIEKTPFPVDLAEINSILDVASSRLRDASV